MGENGAMAAPTTPLPPSKAGGEDERAVLYGYLDYHRTVLARKIEGVSDEDARRAPLPSTNLTLLGLIRHMTDVERWWFRRVFVSEDVPAIFENASCVVAGDFEADGVFDCCGVGLMRSLLEHGGETEEFAWAGFIDHNLLIIFVDRRDTSLA